MSEVERWIVIPRWADFQHYKNRNPPWIKSYIKQLRNDDYLALSLSQRGLLHDLRMFFAEANGQLRESAAKAKANMNQGESSHWAKNLEALNHAGFITFSASKPLPLENRDRDILPKTPSKTTRFVPNLGSYTGCRLVRGTHAFNHRRDPLGTDPPPKDWPYPKPTRAEVAAALEAAA